MIENVGFIFRLKGSRLKVLSLRKNERLSVKKLLLFTSPVLQISKFSNLSGVQVYNLYFRAMGINMEDHGEYHNRANYKGAAPGPPMDEKERNAIPEYLK